MAEAQILRGKTALVTGSSHGMGKAAALLLAQDGASVVIMGRREDVLQRALDDLRAQAPGARIDAVVGDAADEASARGALDKAYALESRARTMSAPTATALGERGTFPETSLRSQIVILETRADA